MTISHSGLDLIAEEMESRPSIQPLAHNATAQICELIRTALQVDNNDVYWWDSTPSPKRTLSYGSGIGEVIREYFGPTANAILFITDDEPPPWQAVMGPAGELASLVENSPFFEYFIVNLQGDRILFDTHHNQVVLIDQLSCDLLPALSSSLQKVALGCERLADVVGGLSALPAQGLPYQRKDRQLRDERLLAPST